MMQELKVIVMYGGVGTEREVSLNSGDAIAAALEANFPVERLRLDSAELPGTIDAATSIVFPALHGSFGEDGQLQALMDAAGIEYCGSGAAASRLCMDKSRTKELARELNIRVPEAVTFSGTAVPLADALIDQLGSSLVIKPTDQGSSVGLFYRAPLRAGSDAFADSPR